MEMICLRLICFWVLAATAQQPGEIPDAAPQVRADLGEGSKNYSFVLDSNWRWVHGKGGYENCFNSGWNPVFCPTSEACAKNCVLEGVPNYATTYGVSAIPGGLRLAYVAGGNVGSRLYLSDAAGYVPLRLINKEIAFDVDLSSVPCGVNAAFYLVAMPVSGGLGGGNKAGAALGTGYCDAQCPTTIKFPNGSVNVRFDIPSCCVEIDLLEANSKAMAWTLHPCNSTGDCDKSGADRNPYRVGNHSFYGQLLDTSRPFRVATQFKAWNNGTLESVRQHYVQDGSVLSPRDWESTDARVDVWKRLFYEENVFAEMGGMASLTPALSEGMVLVASIWDDAATGMQWLDGVFPPGSSSSSLGAQRGPCPLQDTAALRASGGGVAVLFGNLTVSPLEKSSSFFSAGPPIRRS